MNKRRREVAFAVGGVLVLGAKPVDAADRLYRIVFIANTVPIGDLVARRPVHPGPNLVEDGLRQLGWVDGKNIQLVFKSAEGDFSRLPDIAREAIAQRADVIIAFGPGAHAASKATSTIPIVMGAYGTPLEDGLETDRELFRKRISVMKDAVPSLERVAFVQFLGPGQPEPTIGPKTAAALKSLGLNATVATYRQPTVFTDAFETAVKQRAQGVVVDDHPYLYYPDHQKTFHALALKHRLVAMHSVLSAAETGGLMAFAADINDNYRRVPYFVDRILRGAKPAEIPVERPDKIEFVINMRAARALGIAISRVALIQASRVIE